MTTEQEDVFNLTLSNKQRINAILKMDINDRFETIKRLMDIYKLSNIKKLEKFFLFVCIYDTQVNLYLKQDILFILSSKITIKNKTLLQRAFSSVLFLMVEKAINSEEIQLILEETLILYNSSFNDVSIHHILKNFIILKFKNTKVNESFKKIFNLIMCFKEEQYFINLCVFIYENYNKYLKVKSNLLLLQIIFINNNKFKDDLFHIATNTSIDLNLQLEACDILLNQESDMFIKLKVQDTLKNILPDLPYVQNPENVHLSSILESVDKTIKCLLEKNKGKEVPLKLKDDLLKLYKDNVEFGKIKVSLNRIFNYNFLKFSKFNLTLKEIIENIWIFIEECDQELRKELHVRLGQELIDMYNTCSQGYVTRLINVFSGFEFKDNLRFGIAISYEDEIYAIYSTKINNIILNAPEPLKDQLLIELTVPNNDHKNRLNLIRYLRPYVPTIWNEIFELFKHSLTTTDLDLYCRKVTMRYEGC